MDNDSKRENSFYPSHSDVYIPWTIESQLRGLMHLTLRPQNAMKFCGIRGSKSSVGFHKCWNTHWLLFLHTVCTTRHIVKPSCIVYILFPGHTVKGLGIPG